MSPTSQETMESSTVGSWRQSNQAYLELELRRLRLLLQRRVLWLRSRWQHDPLQNYQSLVISEEQADALMVGDDRQGEISFHGESPEAAALSESIAQITAELDGQRMSWDDAGTTPALEKVVRRFGLTPFERQTILLCLAPELDPAFERLYAYVQDDVTRKYPTPHLALTLFSEDGSPLASEADCDPGWAAHDRLGLEAPLRRFELIHLDPPPTPPGTSLSRPLSLDARMVDYLRGVNRLDERVMGLLRPVAPSFLAPSHQHLVEALARSQNPGERPPLPLNLVGPRGAGKREVAAALCDRLGFPLYLLVAQKLPTPPSERQDILRLLNREMILMHSALFLESKETGGSETPAFEAMSDVIEHLSTFFILDTEDRWPTQRGIEVVPVAKPNAGAQRILWQQALSSLPGRFNDELDALVEQFDLSPTAMAQAIALAKSQSSAANAEGVSELTADSLWEACRAVAGKGMEGLAQRVPPCYTWEDIVLQEDVLGQLREIAAQVAHRFQVYETWGFGAKLARGRGISALFAGPSGTGKTMAAEILANHLKLDLFRIDLAGVVSKYIGETEKNLRRVFDAAEQGGAILFFDEADALFGKRSEVKDSHDRYANIEINYLLQRMEEYRGLAVLATNRKSALDRAFLRRLRFLVDFPSPDANSRRKIWERVFPPEAALEGLDLDAMARLEIPGGNIKNIAINAAFLAAGGKTPIGMAHIMRAARQEYAKIGKLPTSAEFGRYHEGVKT